MILNGKMTIGGRDDDATNHHRSDRSKDAPGFTAYTVVYTRNVPKEPKP